MKPNIANSHITAPAIISIGVMLFINTSLCHTTTLRAALFGCHL